MILLMIMRKRRRKRTVDVPWWSELPSVTACDTFSHRPLLSQHAPLSAKIIILEIVIKRFFEIWKIVTCGIMIRKLSTFY